MPIERTERVAIRDATDRVLVGADHVARRRAAVRSRGDGRLCGHRRGHVRRQRAGAASAALRRPASSPARSRATSPSRRRTCVEIATGAPLPDGADAVVMVEETESHRRPTCGILLAGLPEAARRPARRRHRRRPDGAEPGDLLNPSRIGALAAIGVAEVEVYARPRVAILSTGNEVVEPGQPLGAGQIYDINRFTLASVIDLHGGVADRLPDGRRTHLGDADAGARRRARRGRRSCSPAAARSASAT